MYVSAPCRAEILCFFFFKQKTAYEITVNKRMSSHFSLTSGATYGQTKRATAVVGAPAAAADLNNPNVVNNPYFAGGITGGDRPWSYRLSGVLDLPFAFQLSGTGIVQAGNTEPDTVLVPNSAATPRLSLQK